MMMNTLTLHSGYAVIVGRPNVGKSTMMNRIIGQKIAITSNKPQTTRNRIQTVYTDRRGQIIFLDTPGINRSRNRLGEYMLGTAVRSLNDADVVLWIVEPSEYIGTNEQTIIGELRKCPHPVVLVINKADTVPQEKILESIVLYKEAFPFREIVPVSAKTGYNMDELLKVLFELLPTGPMYYDEDTLTDQPVRQIVAEIIREKALHCLSNEVPHGIAVVIDRFCERERITDIEATVVCEKDSHKGIIIGKGGSMLKKIGTTSRYEIEKLVGRQVNLRLWVKVKKDWRDSDTQLKNFGYE